MLVEAILCLVGLLCLYFALRKPPALPPGVWGLPVFGKFPSRSKCFPDQVKELRPRYGDIITHALRTRRRPNPQCHSPSLGAKQGYAVRSGGPVHLFSVAGSLCTSLAEAEVWSAASAGADAENEGFNQVGELYILINDLMQAGLETTITTLRWAILYLTKFPEVQRRVQREIDNAVPRGTLPLYKDRTKLPYLEAVVSEVHRVVSLVPLAVPHQASVDTQLEGYAIPKGTVLCAHLECCHKDPELWERPNEFYPEHFLDADWKYINREGLMPFSVGRRVCVGESLARVELYVFLVALLQSFTFSAPEGEELSKENDPANVLLNLCKEYRVTIKERL